jgi:hypothetical protein
MRERLKSLADLLHEAGDGVRAALVEDVCCGPDAECDAFLVSNELWGGPGSIADCAGVGEKRSAARLKIEHLLVQIGNEQMRSGHVNPRTEMWLRAFTAWERAGI